MEAIVCSLARKLATWYAPAEDLEQEGRLGVLAAVESYRPGRTSFDTWAYHCARSRMLHYRRDVGGAHRQQFVCAEVEMKEWISEPDFAPSVIDRAWADDLLSALLPRHRAMLRMIYFDQKTVREANAALGISANNSLLHRALGAARRQIERGY